ncbi:MAG: hypothetical protein U0Q10_13090 [Dermatophilaceae bacterium]
MRAGSAGTWQSAALPRAPKMVVSSAQLAWFAGAISIGIRQ